MKSKPNIAAPTLGQRRLVRQVVATPAVGILARVLVCGHRGRMHYVRGYIADIFPFSIVLLTKEGKRIIADQKYIASMWRYVPAKP